MATFGNIVLTILWLGIFAAGIFGAVCYGAIAKEDGHA